MDVLAQGGSSTGNAALLAAVLLDPSVDAQAILAAATQAGVDPLDYCARRLGMGEALVMRRAAAWAGLPFAEAIPPTIRGSAALLRLDALADARAIHALADGVDSIYFAPGFTALLALGQRRAEALRRGLILAPHRAIRRALAEVNSPALLVDSRQRLVRRWPHACASLDLSRTQRIAFVAILAAIVAFAAIAPLLARPLLLPFLLVVIVAPALLRLVAAVHQPPEPQALADLPPEDLPRYTILVPLRDEAGMVPQLHDALTALDYPPEKLEILFLVESGSPETIAAVDAIADDRIELIAIPPGPPQTKPKALDYALPLVSGAFVVVFDAEDIPDRDQLRRAASRFAQDPSLECLQAELVIDNGAESWLTALFAGEYAGLFSLLLPFLATHDLPLPLGGTSNHFRTASLREVGGWDAFNVTEDADLGVRLARLHLRTGTLRSATAEEAPIRLAAWMRQRTRWIKGWMQTYIVHNRHPRAFLRDIGWRNFLFFQIYVGSLIVSSLIHTVFALTLALQIALHGLGWPRLADIWDVVYLAVLLVGYGGAFGLALAGLARQRQGELAVYQALLPVYWLLHAVAALRAAVELVVRPYFWSKTRHGETQMVRVIR